MQPYIFPYIGYFQLMDLVDEFVIYDNIEYTKKGWINRNRILSNGKDIFITIPLKKDSDFLNIDKRFLSEDWQTEKKKLTNRIIESYRKAPHFKEVFPIIESIINSEEKQLFKFLLNSIEVLRKYLGITTKILVSSEQNIDHTLKSSDKVIALCKFRNADIYINSIGGLDLYNIEEFKGNGIELKFIKTKTIEYQQYENVFIPNLSIIDVLMFNNLGKVKQFIKNSFTII